MREFSCNMLKFVSVRTLIESDVSPYWRTREWRNKVFNLPASAIIAFLGIINHTKRACSLEKQTKQSSWGVDVTKPTYWFRQGTSFVEPALNIIPIVRTGRRAERVLFHLLITRASNYDVVNASDPQVQSRVRPRRHYWNTSTAKFITATTILCKPLNSNRHLLTISVNKFFCLLLQDPFMYIDLATFSKIRFSNGIHIIFIVEENHRWSETPRTRIDGNNSSRRACQ